MVAAFRSEYGSFEIDNLTVIGPGLDVGVELVDSFDSSVTNSKFLGTDKAITGVRVKNFTAHNNYHDRQGRIPPRTLISLAIERALYGHV